MTSITDVLDLRVSEGAHGEMTLAETGPGVPSFGLNALRDEALRIATEHGFTEATPLEDLALIVSEVAEAIEDIRAGRELNVIHYEARSPMDKPCGVPSELADIIIRVAHFAGKHGIDIERAVQEKMRFNESRPFRHGKKI